MKNTILIHQTSAHQHKFLQPYRQRIPPISIQSNLGWQRIRVNFEELQACSRANIDFYLEKLVHAQSGISTIKAEQTMVA